MDLVRVNERGNDEIGEHEESEDFGLLQSQSQKRSLDFETSIYDSSERPTKLARTTSSEEDNEPRLSATTLGLETVTIYIGPSATEYTIHANLLYLSSSFFQTHFQPLNTTPPSSLSLPDISTQTFELFLAWLYSGTIDNLIPSPSSPSHHSSLATIAQVYYFAQKLHAPHLKDVTFGLIRLATDQIPGALFTPAFIKEVYGNTPEGCRLRTWSAILWVRCLRQEGGRAREVMEGMVGVCKDEGGFLRDVFRVFMEGGRERREVGEENGTGMGGGDVSFFDTLPVGAERP